MLKTTKNLILPFSDAENYRRNENKHLLNDLYLKTDSIDGAMDPNVFFICGEKGTGKSALAAFLHNNDYKNTKTNHVFLRQTELQTLVNLKEANRLTLPDNQLLWEVIILLRIARMIDEAIVVNGWGEKSEVMRRIKLVLKTYYEEKQNPEIVVDIEVLSDSELSGEIAYAGMGISAKGSRSLKENFKTFRDLLYSISTSLKDAIKRCKLSKNLLLIFDGLDTKPQGMNNGDYKMFLSSLGQTIWTINNDFLSEIGSGSGKIKTALLIRPELIDFMGLNNSGLRLRDNAINISWVINNEEYHRNTQIFGLINHILGIQQPDISYARDGKAWDAYMPFTAHRGKPSFIGMLRKTFQRPRDIIVYLTEMQKQSNDNACFSMDDFYNTNTVREYSEYLLGEVRNGLEFLLDEKDKNLLPVLFHSFKGRRHIEYEIYLQCHTEFMTNVSRRGLTIDNPLFKEPDQLLQLLYDCNLIAYIEKTVTGQDYYHWCYRERTFGNPKPLVAFNSLYMVHNGMGKSLDIGAEKVD